MKSFRTTLIFFVAGVFSILLGLGLSMKWMGPAQSEEIAGQLLAQNAPTDDLPPELLEIPPENSTPTAAPAPSGPAVNNLQVAPEGKEDALVELPLNPPEEGGIVDTYVQPKAAADGYIYDPTGRRDPFRPFKLGTRIGIGSANLKNEMPSEIPLEPLQKFELSSFEVLGIIWDISKPKALVRDPNRVVHTVVRGQKIGKNDGFIAEIREGEIIVVEAYEDQGRIVKDARILSIKK